MSKKDFKSKGKAILSAKQPQSLAEVLTGRKEEVSTKAAAVQQPVSTASRTSVQKTKKKPVRLVERKTIKPTLATKQQKEEKLGKAARGDFRLTEELSERLRLYAFEKRTNKTRVVEEALEEYLKRKGY